MYRMAVSVSAIVEVLTAHLREKRPDWVVLKPGYAPSVVRVWWSAAEAEAFPNWSSTFSVETSRSGIVTGVEVRSTCTDVRRVTYKALADLPALCAKVEARLAEGFAVAVERRAAARRADVAARRAEERRQATAAAYPLAFTCVCFDGLARAVPGALATVALDAIEAHLKARQGAA